jgi:hypothetical protein
MTKYPKITKATPNEIIVMSRTKDRFVEVGLSPRR